MDFNFLLTQRRPSAIFRIYPDQPQCLLSDRDETISILLFFSVPPVREQGPFRAIIQVTSLILGTIEP